MLDTKYSGNTSSTTYLSFVCLCLREKTQKKTLAGISTLLFPLIYPHLKRAKNRQIIPKNSRFLHINRHMETSLHSRSRFIQDPDVNQRLKRRHTAPALQKVFGLVRNQHQFPSRRIDFTPRTYFVRPKTCYYEQQSSQYPIVPSQARDQSFTHVSC